MKTFLRLSLLIASIFLMSSNSLHAQYSTIDYAPVKRTLMSFNIRNATADDGKVDFEDVVNTILSSNADVVALQELDSVTNRSKQRDVLHELALLSQYYPIYGPAINYDGGKYGVGILSKQRPLNVKQISLPGREEARTMLVAEFDDFAFACTHLSLTEDDRMESLALIKAEAEKYSKPFFVAGDFNATPQSPLIEQLTDDFDILTPVDKPTFPSSSPNICIDYIALYKPTGSPIVLRENKVLPKSIVSDHLPVIASFQKKTLVERMLFGRPYLQNPTTSSVSVMFQSRTRVHAWVEYGVDTLNLHRAQMEYGGQAVCHDIEHRVPLADLLPGTTYYYRVCAREILHYAAYNKVFGDTLVTDFYSFTTPEEKSTDFTALILNDLHQNKYTIKEMAALAKNIPHDFVVFNGDCLTEPASQQDAIRMVHNITEAFNTAEVPAFFVRGNHEIRNSYSAGLPSLLEQPGGQTYGAFSWGDTRFVILDCGEDKPDDLWVYYGLNDFSAFREQQKAFLQEETKTKCFSKAKRRVLISHIPIWGSSDNYQPCTELWSPVLEDAKFDIALSGHTHSHAFHSEGEVGNPFPVCIGAGPKESEATMFVLSKCADRLTLRVLKSDGEEVGCYDL